MLYQKIHSGETPYSVSIGGFSPFQEHRHADFVLNFCVEGSFDILADKKLHHVEAGCTTLLPPMCAHEIPGHENERTVLTLTVGMSLLKRHFSDFSRLTATARVYDLRTPENKRIYELLMECADIKKKGGATADLLLTGNIYKIFGYLFDAPTEVRDVAAASTEYLKLENVEKALELIYYNYKEPLSVEYVAELTGYSKGNFCKIFKLTVGEGFHQALNRQRVSNAAAMLRATSASVADVASEVGFTETKSFCRVFKVIMGVTPGQYRREG
jgi:AraC-like DNA-binding protein